MTIAALPYSSINSLQGINNLIDNMKHVIFKNIWTNDEGIVLIERDKIVDMLKESGIFPDNVMGREDDSHLLEKIKRS